MTKLHRPILLCALVLGGCDEPEGEEVSHRSGDFQAPAQLEPIAKVELNRKTARRKEENGLGEISLREPHEVEIVAEGEDGSKIARQTLKAYDEDNYEMDAEYLLDGEWHAHVVRVVDGEVVLNRSELSEEEARLVEEELKLAVDDDTAEQGGGACAFSIVAMAGTCGVSAPAGVWGAVACFAAGGAALCTCYKDQIEWC